MIEWIYLWPSFASSRVRGHLERNLQLCSAGLLLLFHIFVKINRFFDSTQSFSRSFAVF